MTETQYDARNYPIWVREQGVGRNKSDIVTIVMDALYHGGGDYHTTYWPQPSYLSSRSPHTETRRRSFGLDINFSLFDRTSLEQKP